MKKMIWGAIACLSFAACSNGRNHNDTYENGMDRSLEDTGMYRTDSPDAVNQPGAISRNAVDSAVNTDNNSTNRENH